MSKSPTLKIGDTGDTVELWQQSLTDAGYDPGRPDGIFGPRTEAATKRFEADNGLLTTGQVSESHWNIMLGGPSQPTPKAAAPSQAPAIHRAAFPKDDPTALRNFFGRHELNSKGTAPTPGWERRNLTQIRPPWPMFLAWEPDRAVITFACHKSVARSLICVLERIKASVTPEQIRKDGLHLFGGCYCYRPRRTSARLSLHAYGAAIDLDPDRNALGTSPDKAAMPAYAIEAFEAAGWTWGGRWKKPDPMHFEATA